MTSRWSGTKNWTSKLLLWKEEAIKDDSYKC